jgi:hypothetical protein
MIKPDDPGIRRGPGVGIGSDDVRKIKPGTALRLPTRHPVGDKPIAVIHGTVCAS